MHAISSYHGNRPTPPAGPPTSATDTCYYNTLCRSLARSVTHPCPGENQKNYIMSPAWTSTRLLSTNTAATFSFVWPAQLYSGDNCRLGKSAGLHTSVPSSQTCENGSSQRARFLLSFRWRVWASMRQPTSDADVQQAQSPITGWQSSARYGGARPRRHLLTSIAILYIIRWWTGSQCKSRMLGVMWSNLHVPVISCAAAFWTPCGFQMTQSAAPTNMI